MTNFKGDERRKHERINKNFIMTYFNLDNPARKFEITQIKNISKGGLCFITSRALEKDSIIGVELRTPYLTDITHLQGKIIACRETIKNMLYETRMEFSNLDPKAEHIMEQMIEFFLRGGEDKKYGEY